MNGVVAFVIEMLAFEISDRQIEWVLPELPKACADPNLIQQVFANLIGNAIKYSRNREMARIEIGSLNSADEPVYFVKDNGAGFDKQFSGRLFKVFQRLHRVEEFEGSGIRLNMVHRIIQRHGGRIWVEAEAGRGATFYFTLIARYKGYYFSGLQGLLW